MVVLVESKRDRRTEVSFGREGGGREEGDMKGERAETHIGRRKGCQSGGGRELQTE